MAVASVLPAIGSEANSGQLRVALSDRAMNLRHSTGAFDIARMAGAAGVEVDFGKLGSRPAMLSRLLDAPGQAEFLDAADSAGVSISSIAFTAFAEQPFTRHPRATDHAAEMITAAGQMNIPVAVIPVGDADELSIADSYETCVTRLKSLAPLAEAAGVTLAVETDLPTGRLSQLLTDVGSPAVNACVYVSFESGISRIFGILGTDRIAQIRFRFDGSSTQAAELNELHSTCRAAKWDGWVVIDRMAMSAGDVVADGALAVGRIEGARFANYS